MPPEAEQQQFEPDTIDGEQGAIHMEVTPDPDDNMTFKVEVASFSPAYYMVDETGTHVAMTQVTAPDGAGAPGTYEDTVVCESEGPHHIIAFNGITRVREMVYAGDIPVWDPVKVAQNARPAGRQAGYKAQAAQTMAVTHKLGG
jgi:hypothetical protein